MADIKKIRLSGVTYNIVDDNALHTLDNTVTSGGTNAVKGSGIYDAITASSAAVLETVGQAGYQTATDVENAISGKADSSTVDSLNSVVTAHTANTDIHVTVADKTAWNAKLDASDITGLFGVADYDSTTHRINFYNTSTGGTVLSYIDASPFLVDGMVENVVITSVTSGGSEVTVLEITFNTDAGKQAIDIPISQIFDASNYYTKTDVDGLLAAKADTATTYTKTEVDTALSGKQATLSAGTGIDITNNTISVTGVPLTMDDNVTSGSSNPVKSSGIYNAITAATDTKQDTLVSGTNIKTVGTNSLLGSGNIALMTASLGSGNDSETLIFDFA